MLTLLVWYNDNDAYITSITSTAMDDHPQLPPPTDAPNVGDPTPRTLRLGDFIIEGVDRSFAITIPVMLSGHLLPLPVL